MPQKGLFVTVLKDANGSDCTNGGVTSKATRCILAGPGIEEIFYETDEVPALKLVRRTIGGKPYLHAQPFAPVPPNACGYMFGGNFIYCSDSRFSEINNYPIPVHDRIESAELNRKLSA